MILVITNAVNLGRLWYKPYIAWWSNKFGKHCKTKSQLFLEMQTVLKDMVMAIKSATTNIRDRNSCLKQNHLFHQFTLIRSFLSVCGPFQYTSLRRNSDINKQQKEC